MYLAALCWGGEKCTKDQTVCLENLTGRHAHYRIILQWNFKKVGCAYVDRIYLAQNVVQWLAVVNMAMSLWVL